MQVLDPDCADHGVRHKMESFRSRVRLVIGGEKANKKRSRQTLCKQAG